MDALKRFEKSQEPNASVSPPEETRNELVETRAEKFQRGMHLQIIQISLFTSS